MKKLLFCLAIFTFLFSGCAPVETVESAKVSPSEIRQDYTISTNRSRTEVTATFYANRASVDLDDPSRIELNGQEMNESKPFLMKGTDYHYSSDKFESRFQFALHTADGKIYRNEIIVQPLEIASQKLNLSRTSEVTIRLSRAVEPNETITFSLWSKRVQKSSKNKNFDSENETFSTSGDVVLDDSRTSFVIDSNRLENFPLGKATLKLKVSKNADVRQSTGGGGRLSAIYDSQNVTVTVAQ